MDHHEEGSFSGSCKKTDSSEDKAQRRRIMLLRELLVEDVNKQADDFIKKFRKQLKVERQESLKRHR
ncbi:UNVERIFIED_CONTAM: hypothetical protein Sindi_0559800 [Sesamum indicum]